jgi:hypothetical protein
VCSSDLALAEGMLPPVVSLEDRGRFLLDYIDLLLAERIEEPAGFRHGAPTRAPNRRQTARSRERWVINKIRALAAWYTKGLDGGPRLREALNAAESLESARDLIRGAFLAPAVQKGSRSASSQPRIAASSPTS